MTVYEPLSDEEFAAWSAITLGAENAPPTRFISLDGIKPKPVRWLWDGRIPVGVGTLIAGLPGGGKTHVLLHMGAMVTQGALQGDYFGKPGGFVVMSREDLLEQTIVPRLIVAEADMSRVFALPFSGWLV
jgi:RecA-family ATPase